MVATKSFGLDNLSSQGDDVVAQTESAIDDAAAAHPSLDGKTYAFFVGPQPDSTYVVNSTDDAGAKFLDQLGLTLTPFATAQPVSDIPGHAQISNELLADTDADLILATSSNGALESVEQQPVFQSLGAVERGAYVPLAPTLAQSIAFPSPPSLDWALEQVVPLLDSAVQR
ncbi:ABC transporter substrate-binding protein [Rhodococcus sp. IEGM 248]|nr:ABC transporter substrate-binding protein [Rhodococcus sp. IEGM 248]